MDSERIDRILIIDDDPATLQVLERALRRLGYEVTAAEDGEAGLTLATENPPDVILTDIQMPKLDGHTLLRRLKSQGLDCAVVMMSGHGGMDDVVDAMRNGAVDYVKKPWMQSDLAAAVARAVEIAETRRTLRRQVDAPRVTTPPVDTSEPRAASSRDTSDLPGAVTPTAQEKQSAAFAEILGELRRGALTLPPVPSVLAQLRGLLATPAATLEQVVSLVERDPHSAIQVIQLANSVQFGGLTRVIDLRTAVTRLGFRFVESLVQTAFAKSCLRSVDARFRPMQARLWKHSVALAVSMRALAELAGPASGLNPRTAYLAGLMSDSGAALLLWVIAERTRSVPPSRDSDVLVDCAAMLRAHHEEVGAMLLSSWNMEPLLAQVAGYHHAEVPPPGLSASAYWSLGILASRLAEQLTRADDVTKPHPVSAAQIERSCAEVQIGDTALKRVTHKLEREIEGLLETLA